MLKNNITLKNEDAPPTSVSGGAVPSITDPTTNYAFQIKKRMKNKILRRKSVSLK